MIFSCIVYIILGILLPVSWDGWEGKYSNLHSLLKDKMPCLTRSNIQKVKSKLQKALQKIEKCGIWEVWKLWGQTFCCVKYNFNILPHSQFLRCVCVCFFFKNKHLQKFILRDVHVWERKYDLWHKPSLQVIFPLVLA